ncbi:hypothetical protein EDC19_2076 [Natranaerovirga hydrolytica]|uniref:DUF1573 domain-containing protein n=1 Tax=Natranaerovirga hydrolytica TaxID=680378 RepID=A0A4R1MIA5_9FIRM|nr:DUF1573 domain-containing protein [Natranaerovirga hydrolytica]TCK92346.1 hypothetical protein EDC19_2076 [Natranaerovirga hydrolytica]
MSILPDSLTDELQFLVEEYELINTSILDQMTKFSDYCSKINRSIIKSCTQCGCVKIDANKNIFEDLHQFALDKKSTHCFGDLCPDCKELIEKNIGSALYYLASICNSLDLNLYDILIKEIQKVDLLRKYNIE